MNNNRPPQRDTLPPNWDKMKTETLAKMTQRDKSPKGSVDAPIVELIRAVNAHVDYVTTSSCSGRISIYHHDRQRNSHGEWLLASHALVEEETVWNIINGNGNGNDGREAREFPLVEMSFKHEPFLLHVNCRTVEAAQHMLQCAVAAGFRESGITVGRSKIILAIRSTSGMLETPVNRFGRCLISREYCKLLVEDANGRFLENVRRVKKFEDEMIRAGIIVVVDSAMGESRHYSDQAFGTVDRIDWITVSGDEALKRWGHAATLREGGADHHTPPRVYVFGGWGNNAGESGDGHHTRLNDLLEVKYELNEEDGRSSPPRECAVSVRMMERQPSGLIGRVGATLDFTTETVHGRPILVLFGGRTSPLKPLNDLWYYELSGEASSNWHHIESQNPSCPPARFSHVSFIHEGFLYIHGGRGNRSSNEESAILSDLWRFDLKKSRWEEVINVKGEKPSPRFSHAAVVVPRRDLVILHGGLCTASGALAPSNEVYVLDLVQWEWKRIQCPLLRSRFSHSLVVVEGEVAEDDDAEDWDESEDTNDKGKIVGNKVDSFALLVCGGCCDGPSFEPVDAARVTIEPRVEAESSKRLSTNRHVSLAPLLSPSQRFFTDSRILLRSFVEDGERVGEDNDGLELREANPILNVKSRAFLLNFQRNKDTQGDFRLILVGGGVNCFAFGTIFSRSLLSSRVRCRFPPLPSSSPHLDPVLNKPSADQQPRPLALKVSKRNAEKVRSWLKASGALDPARPAKPFDSSCMAIPMQAMNSGSKTLLERLKDDFPEETHFEIMETAAVDEQPKIPRETEDPLLIALLKEESRFEVIQDVLVLPKALGELTTPASKSGTPPPSTYRNLLNDLERRKKIRCNRILQLLGGVKVGDELRRPQYVLLYPRSTRSPEGGMSGTEDHECVVTIKEHGVNFTLDLTRVMFSKGNVSEKHRFATECVREGEVVVDAFAGIGYFTVPALASTSKVRKLFACEWNPDSLQYLRMNIADNVTDADRRVVVVPGDVRTACDRDSRLVNVADRVSLGLLPSSRVGWEPAVRFLRNDGKGGWVHVHENLPSDQAKEFGERELIPKFEELFKQVKGRTWRVRIEKIVRVKSYSPKVDHFVFDLRCDDGGDENGRSLVPGETKLISSENDEVDGSMTSSPSHNDQREERLAHASARARNLVRLAVDAVTCVGSHEGAEGRRRLRELMQDLRDEIRFPDV